MALSNISSISKLISSAIVNGKVLTTKFNARQGLFLSSTIHNNSCTFAKRSLWYLSNKTAPTDLFRCRYMHTEGDRDLSEFLKAEIDAEKENLESQILEVQGFRVERAHGAEVVLVKEIDGETIRVRTLTNNSIDDDSEASGDVEAEPQIVCRPPFTVEIEKRDFNKTLHLSCEFPHPETMQEEAQEIDVVEIREIALIDNGKKWEDETFAVAGAVMDGHLYDRMMSMLEERGIDGAFCDQFVSYVTSYEHNTYVDFLGDIQKFVESK